MTSDNHTKHATVRTEMENMNMIATVLFVGLLLMFTIGMFQVLKENQRASVAENPTAIECGSCGAHVYEYWYVENINDGTPVGVCRYCYENYVDNTDTEN